MYFYDKTIQICDDLTIVYEGMFKTLCEHFKVASISLEQEVTRK